MSDLSDLHDHENKPRSKNPFKGRPIPKTRIEWAIRSTLSIRAAAIHLGVAYNTFKCFSSYSLISQNRYRCVGSTARHVLGGPTTFGSTLSGVQWPKVPPTLVIN